MPARIDKFQHTAARRRLVNKVNVNLRLRRFQHTAARRRLDIGRFGKWWPFCFNTQPPEGGWVGGHSLQRFRRCFNTQPPEGGWGGNTKAVGRSGGFQHTAARRRLDMLFYFGLAVIPFQHTAARRRLGVKPACSCTANSFNTQPPEGGWNQSRVCHSKLFGFNTQPPEGGWKVKNSAYEAGKQVSTHSRPKAAGGFLMNWHYSRQRVSTHSRPKAAGLAAA